jgi:type I restriction enzyme S subunit
METDFKNTWRETTLGEEVEIISGGTPKTAITEYWNGNIPWLSVADFNDRNRWVDTADKSITELGVANSATTILKKGDLIISARGTVGALAQLKRDMAFNQSCYGIRAKERTSNDFLYYFIRSKIRDIKRNVHGAVFDTITRETFNHIKVLIPGIEEQKSITSVLSCLDNKIDLLQRQNETLEQIAQTIFSNLFEDSKNMTVTLDKVIELNRPLTLKKGMRSAYFDMGALPVKGSWIAAPIERVFTSGSKFQNGDTLLARITPCLENGKTAFVQRLSDGETAWGSTEFIVMRSKAPFPLPFSYLVARSNAFREFAVRVMSGTSGRQRVQTDMLASYKLSLPDEAVIREFFSTANHIFLKIKNNSMQIDVLDKMRDTLLPRLMNLEIKVK